MKKTTLFLVFMLVFNAFVLMNQFLVPTVNAASPTVTTNSTTDITDTTATLHGFLSNDGGENCSFLFQYGLTDSYGNETYVNKESIELYQENAHGIDGSDGSHDVIDLNYSGSYSTSGGMDANFYDGDWGTASDITMPGGTGTAVITYYKPSNCTINSAIWKVKDRKSTEELSIPSDVLNYYTDKIELKCYVEAEMTSKIWWYGYNGEWVTLSYKTRSTDIDPFEEAVYWNVSAFNYSTGDIFSYDLSGLSPSITYHYRSVANNTDGISYGSDMTFHTMPPDPVTNETWVFDSSTQSLTLNWTLGNYSNYTLIRKSSDSYPSSVTDGTLVYNNTGNGTVDTSLDQAYLYTFWAYNSTWNSYSDPVYLNWSASWLNCYNENNASNISCWTVEISNSDGSEVYLEECCNNSHIINISDTPSGDNTIFTFSADGYETRSYVLDVEDVVNLDAYLPPEQDQDIHYTSQSVSDPSNDVYVLLGCDPERIVQVEGYNESLYGHWFTIPDDQWSVTDNNVTVDSSVLDENTSVVRVTYYCDDDVLDYLVHVVDRVSNPLSNAKIQVKRLIDDAYENVLSVLTDGNGDAACYLIPDQHYKIVISKTNYETETADWTPSENIRTKTYRLQPLTDDVNVSRWDQYLDIDAELTDSCVLWMNYTDALGNTSSVNVTVEMWNGTTFNSTVYYYNSSSNSFSDSTSVNCSYGYRVKFTVDHGDLGVFTHTIMLNRRNQSIADADTLEDMFTSILGDNPFGWINFIAVFIMLAGLFAFGEQGAGFSLLGTGFTFLFLNVLITGFIVSTLIPVLFVILGLLVTWMNMRRVHA